jgi:hypothetical protein
MKRYFPPDKGALIREKRNTSTLACAPPQQYFKIKVVTAIWQRAMMNLRD